MGTSSTVTLFSSFHSHSHTMSKHEKWISITRKMCVWVLFGRPQATGGVRSRRRAGGRSKEGPTLAQGREGWAEQGLSRAGAKQSRGQIGAQQSQQSNGQCDSRGREAEAERNTSLSVMQEARQMQRGDAERNTYLPARESLHLQYPTLPCHNYTSPHPFTKAEMQRQSATPISAWIRDFTAPGQEGHYWNSWPGGSGHYWLPHVVLYWIDILEH